jgi:MoaA/NifB/PqqE/SkfB family radical SAM enzyme
MQPIDVHIHTNTHCNLQCTHCYEDTGELTKMNLDEKFEINLIKFFCNAYNADIHLEGGEIFLEESLITALLDLDESVRRHLTITTNGTVRSTNADTIKALTSVSCLRVSVEGHNDVLHKSVRGCELSTILDNALFYQSQGIPIILRITVNKLNIKNMFEETIPSLEKKGFSNFQIYEMQPVGRGKTSGLCITERLDLLYEGWLRHPTCTSVKVSLPNKRKYEVFEYIMRLKQAGVDVYEVGKATSISIGVDGVVRVCPWNMDSEPLMIVRDDNLELLSKIINAQAIPHECDFCSRIVLKGGAFKC